jgi:hypothetical protein
VAVLAKAVAIAIVNDNLEVLTNFDVCEDVLKVICVVRVQIL